MRRGELLKPPLPLCTHNKSRVFICTEKAKKKSSTHNDKVWWWFEGNNGLTYWIYCGPLGGKKQKRGYAKNFDQSVSSLYIKFKYQKHSESFNIHRLLSCFVLNFHGAMEKHDVTRAINAKIRNGHFRRLILSPPRN